MIQLKGLIEGMEKAKAFFMKHLKEKERGLVQVYTHIDADGISAGAIIGKALYRANIPFQIRILRQLEKEEIEKIKQRIEKNGSFTIFTDFGSGQYLELEEKLLGNGNSFPFLILDHHLPQTINKKEENEKLLKIKAESSPWHLNPYFFGVDGSIEISGAGMAYYFAKILDVQNRDLSAVALVGATGDIQNQGPNKSFFGANGQILKDAKELGLIEVLNDLNFSSIKPLHESIAYSSDIDLPGLSGNPNKTLKFLKTLGILMETQEGTIRTLGDLSQDEKQKISSAIIEYSTLKLGIDPGEIIENLIVNRYVLKNEPMGSELSDTSEFSNILNACGRRDSGSLGIAIAMGDRKDALKQAKENVILYKKSLSAGLNWLIEEEKIQEMENIQYFYGEDVISENIVGTISSMLVFDDRSVINKAKPIFGYAERKDEEVYKISARAHESIVEKGVNLSEAIREACELSDLDVLGGGHPPAAGTKVPIEKIDIFLKNCDQVIKKQLQ